MKTRLAHVVGALSFKETDISWNALSLSLC